MRKRLVKKRLGYFCPERLLCKFSNEKRSEICIREQFVTRMVRYGGEIENCDFDKEGDANVGLFWYDGICCNDIKPLVKQRILERGAKIRDLQQINNFESVT